MNKDPLVIYCDGRCEPNPGGVAIFGWIAKRGEGEIRSHCAFVCSGSDANSGMAEYRAVISALEWLLGSEYSDQKVIFRTDARQIVGQIKGSSAVRPTDLVPYHKLAMRLIKHFKKQLKFEWIPREENKEADRLAQQAYSGTLRAQRYSRKFKAQKSVARVIPEPDGFFNVPSQHKPDVIYSVDVSNNTCTCPDFLIAGKKIGFCKHIWAVRISLGKEVDDITPLVDDDEPIRQWSLRPIRRRLTNDIFNSEHYRQLVRHFCAYLRVLQ